jgi:RNA polymerase sigma-70 factor (ECF subfamily)
MGPEVDEQALVRLAIAGDPTAFEQLARRHGGRIRAVCDRILAGLSVVDDCVQESLTSAWRSLAGFDNRSLLSTWLHRIAVNEALQLLRRRRPREVPFDHLGGEGDAERPGVWASRPGPDLGGIDDSVLRDAVRQRLLELPDYLRVAVALRDVEEWSNEEIARTLGLTLAATKARIHRGRLRLRATLGADFPERGSARR